MMPKPTDINNPEKNESHEPNKDADLFMAEHFESPSAEHEVKTKDELPDEQVSMNDHPLMPQVVEVIKTVFDPEIPVNIYELGLIYAIHIDEDSQVAIQMTLTTPNCPVAEELPNTVKNSVNLIPEVTETQVELVWEPPWTMARMSEAARLQLGLFG